MMRRVLWGLTGISLALGLAHLGLSLLSWRNASLDVLWFAGSGLAVLLAGLINVAMMRAGAIDRIQRTVWFASNVMTAAFFGLAWWVLPEPQVIVGGLVFAALSFGCARTGSRPARA